MRHLICRFSFLALMLSATSTLYGQATASLRGTVADPSGALVPGAVITIERVATGVPLRTATTDSTGSYHFSQLSPANYRIRVESKGFKSVVVENVEVPINSTVTLPLYFREVGPIFQIIDVNTVDATIGMVISNSQISALPSESRNVPALLSLQPGVVHTAIDDRDHPDARGGSVNGAPSDQSNITLDGIDANDQQTGEALKIALPATLESIQELRVVTINPTASQGRSSGAQISLITRSGTNTFHGSLYEYHRNTVMSANSFFNNSTVDPLTGATLKRPKLIRNVFGGALGGPIDPNRLFFFFNFEDTITRREEPQLRIVPSSTLRQGTLRYRDIAGAIQTVTPQQLQSMDPLGLGPNASILALLSEYPVGNDPAEGGDGGLNFVGYRFNAPVNEDKPSFTARLDYTTPDSRHNIFARGALADFKEDEMPPQFPGQPAARILLTNSKGIAIGHTWTISSRLTNDVRWGFTRQGLDLTGGSTRPGLELRGLDSILNFNDRNESRKLPTHNITEDLAWAAGKHMLQFGVNLRNIHNKRFTEKNTYTFYRSNNGWMKNLGRDVLPDGIAPSFRTPYIRAQMALLGTISQAEATYFVDRNGSIFPIPHTPRREFVNNEFEWYVQDQWKLSQQITVTGGLRYSYFAPPYEKNGFQVRANFDVHNWFAQRQDGGAIGVPSNANSLLSFVLAGKANNAPSFFDPDRNNFAPRVAVAWSPSYSSGPLHAILGGPGQSAIRFGISVVYGRSGGSLPVTTDLTGAVGLSTFVRTPTAQFNYDTAPRFSGLDSLASIPIPPAPPVGFPSTPGFVNGTGFMVDTKLRTPYATTFNLSISRDLPGRFTVETAYVGRVGRRLLALNDFAAPLVNFKDPVSGQTWVEASAIIADLIESNVAASSVAPIPFVENVFAPLAGSGQTASQAFYTFMQGYAPSWMDGLHDLDTPVGGSTIYGRHTFFQQQFDWLPGWTNLGQSSYHAFQLIARKRFSDGFQLDFNYTLAKAIDNGSSVESEGQGAGLILNAFNHRQSLGYSNFDIRHQINSNFVLDIPVGRDARIGAGMSPALDKILGNWRLAGIMRWHSGFPFPTSSGNGFAFPTNYFVNGPPTLKPGIPLPEIRLNKNAPGGPNIFADPAAAYNSFQYTASGFSGSRNLLHGPHYFVLDLGIHKNFTIRDNHQIQFRVEAFNATNTVNFDGRVNPLGTRGIDFDLDASSSFGKLRSIAGTPRILQLGLRYQF